MMTMMTTTNTTTTIRQLPIHGQFCHTPRICNLILLLISLVHLFIDSDVPDNDDTVPFENTTLITGNQNKKVKIKASGAD